MNSMRSKDGVARLIVVGGGSEEVGSGKIGARREGRRR